MKVILTPPPLYPWKVISFRKKIFSHWIIELSQTITRLCWAILPCIKSYHNFLIYKPCVDFAGMSVIIQSSHCIETPVSHWLTCVLKHPHWWAMSIQSACLSTWAKNRFYIIYIYTYLHLHYAVMQYLCIEILHYCRLHALYYYETFVVEM